MRKETTQTDPTVQRVRDPMSAAITPTEMLEILEITLFEMKAELLDTIAGFESLSKPHRSFSPGMHATNAYQLHPHASQENEVSDMKNAIRTFAVAVCVAGTLFTGCMSRSDTTDRVQGAMQENTSNVAEAQQARNSAMADSVQQFKRDSEAVIRTYEKRIAEFKAKIKTEGHENKAVYERKLAALEQKYGDLKTQLREYSAEGKGEWTSFRNEFSRDMDDLGKSISNFFTSDK